MKLQNPFSLWKIARHLGLLCLVLCASSVPALAAGTAAGTAISDSATATYVDPNNSGTTDNATSNTVSVTVAEVAGITLTGSGVTDHTGGTNILPGHVLYYDYLITNTGNDPTGFVIPGTVTITGPATLNSVTYSTDGGTTYSTVSGASATTGSVAATATVKVRVSVTVSSSAAPTNTIAVLLGNTNPNDNSAGTQNQAYGSAPAAGTGKVYTSDVADGGSTGEVNGVPTNGEREASATQSATAGSQPQAFAAVLLTHGALTQGVDSQHDALAFAVSLRVDSSAFTGALAEYVPADLSATSISVDGSTVSRVLISTAIPSNTVLNATPTAPGGWTIVYSVTATTTTAQSALWTTTAPSPLSNTTRVGYVAAGPITKGTTVTGFGFSLLTNGVSLSAATQVAAISQLFGLSSGDTTNALCYDESGDTNPSNFNDDGSYYSNTPTTGIAVPANDGTDAANNNTGTGAGGEDNIYTVQPTGTVSIGPNGQPTAVGPTDANDDYTNQSTAVSAGVVPGSTINPGSSAFTNTIKNTGATTITSTIYVVPLPPTVISGGSAADLPTGTTVTLAYGPNTPVYTYNGTAWGLTSGTPISTTNLAAGSTVNITATVQLPNGTVLSTDTAKGFPVVLRTFVDSNGNGAYDSGEANENTVDRVYTGFLKITVQQRIVDTDGITVVQAYGTSLSTSNMLPGRYIDYLVTYSNVSSSGGTNNIQLNAGSIVLSESGIAGGNNWALDNDSNGVIDTSNVVGKAVDSGGGTVAYYSGSPASTVASDQTGTTQTTDVTRYVVTASGTVGPGASRTFTFRRKLN